MKYDPAKMKRAGLLALQGFGVLVSLVALAVGGVMVVARTDWGGERLRRIVVSRANHAIRGQVGIARLEFKGDRLIVRDVTLRDPEGQLAARVARIEVGFRVLPLLRQEVRLTSVVIEAPRIAAVSEPRGLNLARATAPRTKTAAPPPPKKARGEEGWVLRLDQLQLTDGDVVVASTTPTSRKETAHLGDLHAELAFRYATGNGALDLCLDLAGKSVRAPVGPIRLNTDVHVDADAEATYFAIDGALLGGTIKARGGMTGPELTVASTVVTASVSIPRTTIAGFEWGPVRLEASTQPGAAPKLDLLVVVPGIELTAKTVDKPVDQATGKPTDQAAGKPTDSPKPFELDGRLSLVDLGLTGLALQGLAAGALPTLAGHGDLTFSLGGPPAGAWNARGKGSFDRLRVGETFIAGLTIDGRTTQLSTTADDASLRVAIASITAGATKLAKLQLDLTARRRNLALAASVAGPEPIELGVDGHLDDDGKGLALTRIALAYGKVKWASPETSRLRFGDDGLSLRTLRLEADGGQVLALDGSKTTTTRTAATATTTATTTATRLDAHLIARLRLDLLPALILDPRLGVGGALSADVKASGEAAAPQIVAHVRLEDGRFRTLSKVGARIDATATLVDRRVDGTLGLDAPFAAVDGVYRFPLDLLDSSSVVDVRLDASRVDLGQILRAGGADVRADGKLTSRLRINGTAADPRIEVTLDGRDLEVQPPRGAVVASDAKPKPAALDIGRTRIRVTYENRAAHADVDFTSAHGGTLRVNAGARIDLSYPAVTLPLAVKRLPVQGKVVARDLEVAWIAPLSDRIESLAGQVNADARLAGTVGDPQFIGDVRWRNGQVVTTTADAATARPTPQSRR